MQCGLSSQSMAIDRHEQSIQLAQASLASLARSMATLAQQQNQFPGFGAASNSLSEAAKQLGLTAARTQAFLEDRRRSRLSRGNLDYLGFLPTPVYGSQSSVWPAPAPLFQVHAGTPLPIQNQQAPAWTQTCQAPAGTPLQAPASTLPATWTCQVPAGTPLQALASTLPASWTCQAPAGTPLQAPASTQPATWTCQAPAGTPLQAPLSILPATRTRQAQAGILLQAHLGNPPPTQTHQVPAGTPPLNQTRAGTLLQTQTYQAQVGTLPQALACAPPQAKSMPSVSTRPMSTPWDTKVTPTPCVNVQANVLDLGSEVGISESEMKPAVAPVTPQVKENACVAVATPTPEVIKASPPQGVCRSRPYPEPKGRGSPPLQGSSGGGLKGKPLPSVIAGEEPAPLSPTKAKKLMKMQPSKMADTPYQKKKSSEKEDLRKECLSPEKKNVELTKAGAVVRRSIRGQKDNETSGSAAEAPRFNENPPRTGRVRGGVGPVITSRQPAPDSARGLGAGLHIPGDPQMSGPHPGPLHQKPHPPLCFKLTSPKLHPGRPPEDGGAWSTRREAAQRSGRGFPVAMPWTGSDSRFLPGPPQQAW